MYMSEANSRALARRWQAVAAQERSERMRLLAKRKNELMTPEERSKHAKLMVSLKTKRNV